MIMFIYAYLLVGLSAAGTALLLDRIESKNSMIAYTEGERFGFCVIVIILWPVFMLKYGTKTQ